MTYDEIHPVLRQWLGNFEGYRKAGFSADDIFCEVTGSPGLPPGQLMVYATLKAQGQEFSIECGPWAESETQELNDRWKAVCEAVSSGQVSQIDLDRIWAECTIFERKAEFIIALIKKGLRPPLTLS